MRGGTMATNTKKPLIYQLIRKVMEFATKPLFERYTMKKRTKLNVILPSLLITVAVSACNSGGNLSSNPSNKSNGINHPPSIMIKNISEQKIKEIIAILDEDDASKIDQLYNEYAIPKVEGDIEDHTYYRTQNYEGDYKKGRINFGNTADLFSKYQLKKFTTLLSLYLDTHPNSNIVRFKHLLLSDYQSFSVGKRVNYKRDGYRDILLIKVGNEFIDPHQYFNNQITIYFKKGISLEAIKQELARVDKFLLQSLEKNKKNNLSIDIGVDIKEGFYTSYRNELVTRDGLDFSAYSSKEIQEVIKTTNNFLLSTFKKPYNLTSIYDVVTTYNELNEDLEKQLYTLLTKVSH